MSRFMTLLAGAALAFTFAGPVSAAVIKVSPGDAAESAALSDTLTSLGFTVVESTDYQIGDLVISFPGGGNGPSTSEVSSGVNYIQISDWGSGVISQEFTTITEGITATVFVDTLHPITAGLPASWETKGFWRYGYDQEDYISHATNDALTSLISESVSGFSRVVAADTIGDGRAVHIGFNVYGPEANANDLRLLCNAIEWAGNMACTTVTQEEGVPAPGAIALLGLGLLGFGTFRRRMR